MKAPGTCGERERKPAAASWVPKLYRLCRVWIAGTPKPMGICSESWHKDRLAAILRWSRAISHSCLRSMKMEDPMAAKGLPILTSDLSFYLRALSLYFFFRYLAQNLKKKKKNQVYYLFHKCLFSSHLYNWSLSYSRYWCNIFET